MAVTPQKSATLHGSKAPNLPITPIDYSQHHGEIFANALRLYFNQVDNFTSALSGTTGGGYLQMPFIAASNSTILYATANNTPTKVLWDTLDGSKGFTLDPTGFATASVSGYYKIDYSLQFVNDNNTQHDAYVWLRVNGVDLPGSASKFTVVARKSALAHSYVVAYSSVVYSMNAGDYVELYWATDQAATSGGTLGIFMEAYPAQTSPFAMPSLPSAIGSITFVSAL